MKAPEELKYTEDHEWLRVEGDSITVGITDFAQNSLGDIVYVELPELGASVEAGESIGNIESVKAVAELYCPVSGETVAINNELEDQPELTNSDPYEKGWILKLKVEPSALELDKFMDSTAYSDFAK